ncbi:hypothetical protein BGC07_04900 [Piscirickettsia litoralis]|uniref:YgjP-like metallopeptidase domain-containing protein n=1 Tax=Piscirickettsia litoralis TaxID=1891921 RepID=A0ABX3A8E8_9GAMM|nr:hypothetical protein BGC07_04900 [Piscirickettsia litoralis]
MHYFLGQPYRLIVYSANNNQVRLKETGEENRLYLGVHARSCPESALYGWYRDQAKLIFTERYYYWLSQAQEKLMIAPDLTLKFAIKRLKSRWGSYSTRGRINLNLELIRCPQGCLDMIICHELCHVRELKHNKNFFNDLSCLYPDWQAQSQLLARLSMAY